jgi:thymidylate synthase ThyX
MTTTAEILADSVNARGTRITTFKLRYPRFIHAERLRHRILSCSVASSRAIPTERMIADIERDPVIPMEWGANQRGMSAGAALPLHQARDCEYIWRNACAVAIDHARSMLNAGLHKQWVSRILEPYAHVTEVVTGTSWGNWYALRMAPDAMPEIRDLATKMHHLHTSHTPTLRTVDRSHDWTSVLHSASYQHDAAIIDAWHLPFVTDEERDVATMGTDLAIANGYPYSYTLRDLVYMSIGRCARTSYLTWDNARDPKADIDLANRCILSNHWSPTEHQAPPTVGTLESAWVGNFYGWHQCRKMFHTEHPYESTAIPWDDFPAATLPPSY